MKAKNYVFFFFSIKTRNKVKIKTVCCLSAKIIWFSHIVKTSNFFPSSFCCQISANFIFKLFFLFSLFFSSGTFNQRKKKYNLFLSKKKLNYSCANLLNCWRKRSITYNMHENFDVHIAGEQSDQQGDEQLWKWLVWKCLYKSIRLHSVLCKVFFFYCISFFSSVFCQSFFASFYPLKSAFFCHSNTAATIRCNQFMRQLKKNKKKKKEKKGSTKIMVMTL